MRRRVLNKKLEAFTYELAKPGDLCVYGKLTNFEIKTSIPNLASNDPKITKPGFFYIHPEDLQYIPADWEHYLIGIVVIPGHYTTLQFYPLDKSPHSSGTCVMLLQPLKITGWNDYCDETNATYHENLISMPLFPTLTTYLTLPDAGIYMHSNRFTNSLTAAQTETFKIDVDKTGLRYYTNTSDTSKLIDNPYANQYGEKYVSTNYISTPPSSLSGKNALTCRGGTLYDESISLTYYLKEYSENLNNNSPYVINCISLNGKYNEIGGGCIIGKNDTDDIYIPNVGDIGYIMAKWNEITTAYQYITAYVNNHNLTNFNYTPISYSMRLATSTYYANKSSSTKEFSYYYVDTYDGQIYRAKSSDYGFYTQYMYFFVNPENLKYWDGVMT